MCANKILQNILKHSSSTLNTTVFNRFVVNIMEKLGEKYKLGEVLIRAFRGRHRVNIFKRKFGRKNIGFVISKTFGRREKTVMALLHEISQ